eukprot:SM000071S21074  [mRNA]  locus=s71:189844:191066:- [translate_table: standard]
MQRWNGRVQAGHDLRGQLPPPPTPPPPPPPPLASAAAPATRTQFVKPLARLYPRLPCRHCRGTKRVSCDVCQGRGYLLKGGFHRHNPVNVDRIVGSKWTAMESTFGWRHFQVDSKTKGQGKQWFVEMVSTCESNTRFFVNLRNLKDRASWSMGWLQKQELQRLEESRTQQNICKACHGLGSLVCTSCSSSASPGGSTLDIIEV